MPWTIDRRVGAVAVAVSAAVVLPMLAFTAAPLPERDEPGTEAPESDPEAVEALTRLVERGREGAWLVEYVTERTRSGGGSRSGSVVAANVPPNSLVTDGETLTAKIGGRSFACARLEAGSRCAEGATQSGDGVDLGEVLAGVAGPGRYAVTASPRRSIAGEVGECFELAAAPASSVPAGLARDAELCYARDGVLLAARVERGATTDTRTAESVERGIDEDDLLALLDQFEMSAPRGSD